jgi:hypothetical protein
VNQFTLIAGTIGCRTFQPANSVGQSWKCALRLNAGKSSGPSAGPPWYNRLGCQPAFSGVLDRRSQRIPVPGRAREAISLPSVAQHDPCLIGQVPKLLSPRIIRVDQRRSSSHLIFPSSCPHNKTDPVTRIGTVSDEPRLGAPHWVGVFWRLSGAPRNDVKRLTCCSGPLVRMRSSVVSAVVLTNNVDLPSLIEGIWQAVRCRTFQIDDGPLFFSRAR